jgi:DNA invertase Pin-like site-specific DNA recombinase
MRVALYGRVSTANHGQDVGMQLSELRNYCARRGFEITGEYVDQGVSGAKDSRPGLNRLMASFDAITFVRRLEERQLVRRCRDITSRHVLLRLTPAGKVLLEKLVRRSLEDLKTQGPTLEKALTRIISKP